MPSDMHTHTFFSDGGLSPDSLIEAAKEAGLSYIAITDHDTVDGICQLYESGGYPSSGIKLIPGIEFNTYFCDRRVHIIGYNIDIYNKELAEKLNELSEHRWERFSNIMSKLQKLGYGIKESDVIQIADASVSISRYHIAQAMVNKGLFSTVSEAYDSVLEKGKPAYVEHFFMEPKDIIALIKRCGGTPVLAHPKLIGDDSLVEELLKSGIEGIEAYYPKHDTVDVERYLALADKYNLQVTGGSGFHGVGSGMPYKLGVFTVDDSLAADIYKPPSFLK